MFNLHREGVGSYKSIIEYLKEYNPEIKIKEQTLAALKHKMNSKAMKIKSVPRLNNSEDFIEFVKIKFKDFDDGEFFQS